VTGLRELWNTDGDIDRIRRYMMAGADPDGVHVRVEELAGEPGDAVIMHPYLASCAMADDLGSTG
jgi:hypothetical protein